MSKLTDEINRQTLDLYELADILNRMVIEWQQRHIRAQDEELIDLRRIMGN